MSSMSNSPGFRSHSEKRSSQGKYVQVEALLDRIDAGPPIIAYITQQLQHLGYASWAHRVINTAGKEKPFEVAPCWASYQQWLQT